MHCVSFPSCGSTATGYLQIVQDAEDRKPSCATCLNGYILGSLNPISYVHLDGRAKHTKTLITLKCLGFQYLVNSVAKYLHITVITPNATNTNTAELRSIYCFIMFRMVIKGYVNKEKRLPRVMYNLTFQEHETNVGYQRQAVSQPIVILECSASHYCQDQTCHQECSLGGEQGSRKNGFGSDLSLLFSKLHCLRCVPSLGSLVKLWRHGRCKARSDTGSRP